MVFNESSFLSVVVVALSVWTTALSVVVFRMIAHYNRLTGGKPTIGLKDVLDAMMGRDQLLQARVDKAEQEIRALRLDDVFHIQRIGMVRFNPFADTGGAQSFTMALLDGANNGVVMTSLYGRTGNRWYVKEIVSGKGKEHGLSEEELAAIKQAKAVRS